MRLPPGCVYPPRNRAHEGASLSRLVRAGPKLMPAKVGLPSEALSPLRRRSPPSYPVTQLSSPCPAGHVRRTARGDACHAMPAWRPKRTTPCRRQCSVSTSDQLPPGDKPDALALIPTGPVSLFVLLSLTKPSGNGAETLPWPWPLVNNSEANSIRPSPGTLSESPSDPRTD
jgi:hypothetical protein